MPVTTPTIVVIEDDAANWQALRFLLEEEQDALLSATTLAEAVPLLDTATYDLVLSDLFGATPDERLQSAYCIREHSFPAPVGILTAHPIAREAPELQTFAFVLEKPYDIGTLLTNIAACLTHPIPAAFRPQVAVLEQFFAALTIRDWEALLALCTDDVVYHSRHAGELRGRAAYRAYGEARTQQFAHARFTLLQTYATPLGLAVRYQATWEATLGAEQSAMSASVFRFAGEQICQIGNRFVGA